MDIMENHITNFHRTINGHFQLRNIDYFYINNGPIAAATFNMYNKATGMSTDVLAVLLADGDEVSVGKGKYLCEAKHKGLWFIGMQQLQRNRLFQGDDIGLMELFTYSMVSNGEIKEEHMDMYSGFHWRSSVNINSKKYHKDFKKEEWID